MEGLSHNGYPPMPRGRPVSNRLELTPEQITTLKQIAGSRSEELRRVQRAKVFLAAAEGQPQREIAASVGLSVSAVARMLRKALQIGPMMALDDLKRSGRPTVIGVEARTWVKELACTPPKDLPDAPTQALWSMDTLAEYVRKHASEKPFGGELAKASKSTIWSILDSDEIKPHRSRYYLEKKDPDFSAKCHEVLLLYKRVEMELVFRDTLSSSSQPNGAVFVSFDEKPGIQAIGNVHPDRRPSADNSDKLIDRFGDARVVVNDLLMHLEPLRPLWIPVNKHGSQNSLYARKFDEEFFGELPILTFPAGLCSRCIGGEVTDLPWKTNFLKKAYASQRQIVPVFVEGRLSNFFYRVDRIRRMLGVKFNIEMLWLSDEMFSQKGKHFRILVGDPIPVAELQRYGALRDQADYVRKKAYFLENMLLPAENNG